MKKLTGIDKLRADEQKDIEPATIAQRIQATRIFGAIGGVLFAGFLLTIGYSVYENSKTIPVKGTVIGVSSETSQPRRIGENTTTVYWHEFRYSDMDGVVHIADSVGNGRHSMYHLGDVVSIGYYARDFTKVRVRSWFGLWKIQLTLFGLGLVLITYSIWGVKQIREEERAESEFTSTAQKEIL